MNRKTINIIIASIWFINGFFCKVLNLVPRHEQIVSKILNTDYSRLSTVIIGTQEIVMALWIVSQKNKKWNVITQITAIASMNILEFFLVPELLLWGKLNAPFAFMLITLIYLNHFHLNKTQHELIKF